MSIVAPLLRFAADRWVAAGRADPYREWLAEVAELRSEPGRGGGLRALWFAASLAASRPPAGETSVRSIRPALPGLVALLLLVPLAGDLTYRGARFAMDEWIPVLHSGSDLQSPGYLAVTLARLVGLAAVTMMFAYAGRAAGRRFPLCASNLPTYRLAVTVTAGVTLTGLGVLFEQVLVNGLDPIGLRLSPSGGTAAATALWAVLLCTLAVTVRCRRPVAARLWAAAGGLLATDLAVTVGALPRMLRVPGAVGLLPLWFPATVLDQDIRPIEPGRVAAALATSASPLTGALLTSTAFALAYLVASARPRPAYQSAEPRTVPPRRTAAGWWFALLGGLGWVAAASWLPLAWERLSHRDWDADNSAVLFFAQLDIRKVAILVCCCGLAVALRGTGPAWPAGLAAAALYMVDVALSRAQLPAAVTAVLALTALLLPLAAAAASHRLRRTDRQYGHATLPVVAIVAGCCACAPGIFVDLNDGPLPVLSSFPVAVALCCAALAALGGYCVCRARTEARRPPRRWLWVLVATALAALGAGTAATGSTIPLLLLPVAWPATTVLTIGLLPGQPRPGRRTRLAVLAVALLLGEPVMLFGSAALALVLDALSNPTWVNIGDGLPLFCGFLAVSAVLAIGYRVGVGAPPTLARSMAPEPSPHDPVPAVPQAR